MTTFPPLETGYDQDIVPSWADIVSESTWWPQFMGDAI